MNFNQNPKQLVRDQNDNFATRRNSWLVQSKKQINLAKNIGVAIRKYPTNLGPADYILFVNKNPVNVIKTKREEEGINLTVHEDQTKGYAKAKLRLINAPLVFTYESMGKVTPFTDYCDPKPRSRTVFTFHRPEITIFPSYCIKLIN